MESLIADSVKLLSVSAKFLGLEGRLVSILRLS